MDQRILEARKIPQARIAREDFRRLRRERQDALIHRLREIPTTEILVQIRSIDERRNVIGIQRQRALEFLLGGRVILQPIAVDHPPVQVHFLGAGNAAGERFFVRAERGRHVPGLALQEREVVPGIGQIRPSRQQSLICRDRLSDPSFGIEPPGFDYQGFEGHARRLAQRERHEHSLCLPEIIQLLDRNELFRSA
jgi:hypothetical protein